MQQHMESICVICKHKFKDLKGHIKIREMQRCEDCGKLFSSTKEFRTHRQVHKKNKQVDEEVDILNIDVFELVQM